MYCNTLQHTATHCNTRTTSHARPDVFTHVYGRRGNLGRLTCVSLCRVCAGVPETFCLLVCGQIAQSLLVAVCCSVLQCVAVCCSVLQCVAVCCSVCGHTCDVLSPSLWVGKATVGRKLFALVRQYSSTVMGIVTAYICKT